MKAGSINWKLSQLKPGDHIYLDTTFEKAQITQRRIHVPPDKRPDFMLNWKFETTVLTMIPAGKFIRPEYLVRVKRIR